MIITGTITGFGIDDLHNLAPTTHELFEGATRYALALEASEITPEHLFLAAIMLDDEKIAETLVHLGMDSQVLRSQAQAVFRAQPLEAVSRNAALLLSQDARDCLLWAASLAAYQHVPQIYPVHVLLGCMRHPRVQPLLALLLSSIETILPAYVSEESEAGYTRAVDQLIRSRVRIQQFIYSAANASLRLLTCLERPSLTFADILGFHRAKHELRTVVDFLRKPRRYQSGRQNSVYGILLIGAPGNNRTLLVRAIAGEAVVPLVYLSIPILIEIVRASESSVQEEFNASSDLEEHARKTQHENMQKGREMIHSVFEQARQVSPCVLLLDDLDMLGQVTYEVRTQWQKQLMVEIDARDYHPTFVVIGAANRRNRLEPALLLPGRFDHQVILDGTITKPFGRGSILCPACQHEVSPRWKYCTYCGEALVKTCTRCGCMLPDVLGARFCPECGTIIGA
jgi:SpoVK/Ycf46/Vps4 family AAA+-type ATPase